MNPIMIILTPPMGVTKRRRLRIHVPTELWVHFQEKYRKKAAMRMRMCIYEIGAYLESHLSVHILLDGADGNHTEYVWLITQDLSLREAEKHVTELKEVIRKNFCCECEFTAT